MASDQAILRGFDMPMSDVGDQLHFRMPLLSFRSSPALYVAGRVDWHGDRQALTILDDPDDLEMATLFADGVSLEIASGQGVVVAGADFHDAASLVGDQLGDFIRLSETDSECWMRVAKPEEFSALKRELIDVSKTVFDQQLAAAIRRGSRLAELGDSAMLILRRCGPLRQDDLAMRQLAAARQNRDFDLYRRLLARFEHELGEPEDQLHRQAKRHIELAVDTQEGTSPQLNMSESKMELLYAVFAGHWKMWSTASEQMLIAGSVLSKGPTVSLVNLETERKEKRTTGILHQKKVKTIFSDSKAGTVGGMEEVWDQA